MEAITWAAIKSALPYVGAGVSLLAASNQASSMRDAAAQNAANARAAAEANKAQLDYQAGQETAAGQHAAEAARRKSALMLSRAQAVAAASGGGALDESLMSGIVGEGEKEAGFQLYGANERAKGLYYRGAAGLSQTEAQGSASISQANRAANATLLGGFANAASMARFAPGAPPVSRSSDAFFSFKT